RGEGRPAQAAAAVARRGRVAVHPGEGSWCGYAELGSDFNKLEACAWACLLGILFIAKLSLLPSANVAELVDAPDLGSGAERCESSSLSVRTILRWCSQALPGGIRGRV